MTTIDETTGEVIESFGSTQTRALAEVNTKALEATARAAVESRYVMALKRPRNPDMARTVLLRDCKRPGFADSAMYEKPVGSSKVTGLSVRFAEAAIRAWGNVLCESQTVYDDEEKRIIRITVTDLEANVTFPKEVTLLKRVERRKAASGQKTFGTRTNSYGDTVFIVEATEDDMALKQASAESKALRQAGLRLIPGDILEECQAQIEATLRSKAAADPDAEKKKLLDAFAAINVLPDQLALYLGHPVAQVTEAELVELRRVFRAVKDGEVAWHEALAERTKPQAPPAPTPAAKGASKADAIKAELRARREEQPVTTIDAGPELSPGTQPPSDTGEAPAGDERWTSEDTARLSEELDSIKAELAAAVGPERVDALWKGAKGPGSLRGVRSKAHAKARIDAAYALLEAAKRDES